MRFSISHLLIGTLILAVALGIGFPALKFTLYDTANFTYDRDQSIEYVRAATTGLTRRNLIDAINQLSVWDDERIIIVGASLSSNDIHVELISTSLHPPESLDVGLISGETISVHSCQLESTGTYYLHGNIPAPDKIPDISKIVSIRFKNGESKSNHYIFSNADNGG